MDNADALPAGRTADGAAVSQFREFPRLRANLAPDGARWQAGPAYVRFEEFPRLRGGVAPGGAYVRLMI